MRWASRNLYWDPYITESAVRLPREAPAAMPWFMQVDSHEATQL